MKCKCGKEAVMTTILDVSHECEFLCNQCFQKRRNKTINDVLESGFTTDEYTKEPK